MKLLKELMEMTQLEFSKSQNIMLTLLGGMGISEFKAQEHLKHGLTDERPDRQDHVEAIEFLKAFQKFVREHGKLIQYKMQYLKRNDVSNWLSEARDGLHRRPDGKYELRGVLKDTEFNLNIPFAIGFNHRTNKYYLEGITVMRKDPKTFRSPHYKTIDYYV